MLHPPHAKVMSLLNLMVAYRHIKDKWVTNVPLRNFHCTRTRCQEFWGLWILNKLSFNFVVAIQAYYCYITKWRDYSFDARYIHSLNAPKSLF